MKQQSSIYGITLTHSHLQPPIPILNVQLLEITMTQPLCVYYIKIIYTIKEEDSSLSLCIFRTFNVSLYKNHYN